MDRIEKRSAEAPPRTENESVTLTQSTPPSSDADKLRNELPVTGAVVNPVAGLSVTRRGLMVYCPHLLVSSVTDILPSQLKERDIRAVILDLDNTLVRWAREDLSSEVMTWLESLREEGLDFCLLSNSVLSKRVDRVAEKLHCVNIRRARKPKPDGFHRAMKALGTTAAHTAIIGDQMFTDILGGNRLGLYTIMVKPLHKGEFAYTRFVSRPPERLLLHWFRKRGHL